MIVNGEPVTAIMGSPGGILLGDRLKITHYGSLWSSGDSTREQENSIKFRLSTPNGKATSSLKSCLAHANSGNRWLQGFQELLPAANPLNGRDAPNAFQRLMP